MVQFHFCTNRCNGEKKKFFSSGRKFDGKLFEKICGYFDILLLVNRNQN